MLDQKGDPIPKLYAIGEAGLRAAALKRVGV